MTTDVAPDVSQLNITTLIGQGNALAAAGAPDAAMRLYERWIELHPQDPLVHAALFNLSTLQQQVGDSHGAMLSLQWSLAVNSDFLPSAINLGRLYEQNGASEKALEVWYATVNRPMALIGSNVQHCVAALKQIARVQLEREQFEAAEAALIRCIGIWPDEEEALEQYLALRMGQLRWPVLQPVEPLSGKDLLARLHPLSMAAFSDDALLQLSAAYGYSKRVTKAIDAPAASDRRNAVLDRTNRRLRIGYVSSDLRDHAIGYLMAEFFEVQDTSRLETFAYVIGKAPLTAMSQRIEAAVDHWVDLRAMDDDAAAAQIAADCIDILVDVNGHTRDARLGIFARRPAPIQVNWLGFPGTMGTPFHHYIIADDTIIPPGSEHFYSERVLRLPCYQANDRRRVVTEQPTRAEVGLPDDAFVFCSFNAYHKMTRFTLERWATILRETPGSVLWLLDCSSQAKANMARFMEGHGVSADRLIHAPKVLNAMHLARIPLADLVIDCLPYGAHTTATDALWMGVPVLTLEGRCFAARVCASLVRSAGIPELVTTTPDDFIATALMLAREPAALKALRDQLAAAKASCVLFDQNKLARAIADLFEQMVSDYQAGELPQPDLGNISAYAAATLTHDHENEELTFIGDYEARIRSRLAAIDRREQLLPDSRLWRGG